MKPTRVFLYILTALGEVINLTQIYLQLHHRSLCSFSGCKVVDSFARFGNGFMCGVGAFVFLLLFSFLVLERKNPLFGRLFNLTLIASLAGEGYLVGFQLFGVETLCPFCLGVFSIFVLLGLFRVFETAEVLYGYLSFLAVLVVTFFVPPKGFTPLPPGRFVLIYSPGCPHCHKVMSLLNSEGVKYSAVDYRKVLNLLYYLGTSEVPVLLEREGDKRVFLIGERAIENRFKRETLKEPQRLEINLQPGGACSIFEKNCTSR
jgi:glutaredoxin